MKERLYADVIIPLKFRDYVTYCIPEGMEGKVVPGSVVRVLLVGREYTALVRRVGPCPAIPPEKIKPIKSLAPFPPLTESNMVFLEQVAEYYMCPVGEVFRIAAPSAVKKLKEPASQGRKDETCNPLPELTSVQDDACRNIQKAFADGKNALLHGVTGSGKTEIYMKLAAEVMAKGQNVLLLVPEIAMSRQIQGRLELYFGSRVLTYHSKRTPAHRRSVYVEVAENRAPYLVLGLRSALFLPFRNLGLIIVDEEHDHSYKQTEPAPRYHGRDAALMLGRLMGAPVLLGSATPSFESFYNVSVGKLEYVSLPVRFFGGDDTRITLVDMIREKKKNAVRGAFSLTLLKALADRLEKGEQALVFRSRRAYATAVECDACGYMPRCPHCNIPLSYHKFNDALSCHYCGFSVAMYEHCPECGEGKMKLFGAGTEKIEEELRNLFPKARIERFDADTAASAKEEERILRQFASGQTDILVGTQMLSKGFDFANLTLTAVIKAEAVTSVFDFRADERALQLLRQLMGRAGRRGGPGEMIIQTNHPDHPVFRNLANPCGGMEESLLKERREFGFPPYVRLVRITVKSPDMSGTESLAAKVSEVLAGCGADGFDGPVPPPVEKQEGEYCLQFMVRLDRSVRAAGIKMRIYDSLRFLPAEHCTIDVDPL